MYPLKFFSFSDLDKCDLDPHIHSENFSKYKSTTSGISHFELIPWDLLAFSYQIAVFTESYLRPLTQ